MNRTHAVIVANGDCDGELLTRHMNRLRRETVYLLAVDGGLQHCIDAGLRPDGFLGDADSASCAALRLLTDQAIPQIRFPSAKAASDLQLALENISGTAVEQVWMFGISGGRSDHMLFNWQLAGLRVWPFALHLHDATTEATVVHAGQPFVRSLRPGRSFSVLPLAPTTGVTIDGAAYPLDNVTLDPGQTLGLSNLSVDDRVSVTVASGVALVMLNREAEHGETLRRCPQ